MMPEWLASLLLALIPVMLTAGFGAIGYLVKRFHDLRSAQLTTITGKLEHLDECFDALRIEVAEVKQLRPRVDRLEAAVFQPVPRTRLHRDQG